MSAPHWTQHGNLTTRQKFTGESSHYASRHHIHYPSVALKYHARWRSSSHDTVAGEIRQAMTGNMSHKFAIVKCSPLRCATMHCLHNVLVSYSSPRSRPRPRRRVGTQGATELSAFKPCLYDTCIDLTVREITERWARGEQKKGMYGRRARVVFGDMNVVCRTTLRST